MRNSYRCIVSSAIATFCSFPMALAVAQEFPSKPIRFIVAQSTGTGMDTVARIVAPALSNALGQPVVVENRPGAESVVGLEYVAKRAPADGYTITLPFVKSQAALPLLVKDLRFDPVKDLPPFAGIAEGRQVLGSSSSMPWKTFSEMVAYAKANPGKLNFGSSDPSLRLDTEGLVRNLGLDGVYVSYAIGSAYVQALRTGEVSIGLANMASVLTFGDKFRVLAVTGERRAALLPDVPTFSELGLPQVSGALFSLNVARGTPKNAFDKLAAAAVRALEDQELRARLAKIHLDVLSDPSPQAAEKRLAELVRTFGEVAKKAGMEPK